MLHLCLCAGTGPAPRSSGDVWSAEEPPPHLDAGRSPSTRPAARMPASPAAMASAHGVVVRPAVEAPLGAAAPSERRSPRDGPLLRGTTDVRLLKSLLVLAVQLYTLVGWGVSP